MVLSSADLLHRQKSVHLFKSHAKWSHSLTDYNRGKQLYDSENTRKVCITQQKTQTKEKPTFVDIQTQPQKEDVAEVYNNLPQKVEIEKLNMKPFVDVYSKPYIKKKVSHSTANTLKTYEEGMEFWEKKN